MSDNNLNPKITIPHKESEKNMYKKCLLNIPVDLHKEMKKNCVTNDLNISEFILLAIQEKLNKNN